MIKSSFQHTYDIAELGRIGYDPVRQDSAGQDRIGQGAAGLGAAGQGAIIAQGRAWLAPARLDLV